jgi:ubiquinone/menaquinone biosynthesis C-methylase UbiE
MDARLQRRVQRYGWDKAAAFYEQYWSRQLEPAQRRLIALAELKAGERVLDVACGTGLVTFPAAEAVGATGAVMATDLSDVMVARVAEEAARRRLPQVSSRRMDAESLECADASFDVALCSLGLMYAPDPVQAVKEMHRVLDSHGRAVVSTWGSRSQCGWAEIFPIVDRRVASEVCPMFFQLGSGDNLLRTLERAGFRDISVERLAVPLHYESGDAACGAAFAGGPVALAYSRFDDRTRAEAEAEYLDSIQPWRTDTGYEIPGEFVVARGMRPPS